jgi:transposase-like protein
MPPNNSKRSPRQALPTDPLHSIRANARGAAVPTVDVTGHRHGHRSRSLMGTFGRTEIAVPRARLDGLDGQTTEWRSKTLRSYQRRTLAR